MTERDAPERWLCDVMLARLGRLLRAAGHDVALAGARTPDKSLLAQAADEGRTLLTRDRRLAEAAPEGAFLVLPDKPDDQARLLRRTFGVDWMAAPFTRCLLDNALVRPANGHEMASLPADLPGPVTSCPVCGRLYWPGSHVRRMLRRLEALAERDPASS